MHFLGPLFVAMSSKKRTPNQFKMRFWWLRNENVVFAFFKKFLTWIYNYSGIVTHQSVSKFINRGRFHVSSAAAQVRYSFIKLFVTPLVWGVRIGLIPGTYKQKSLVPPPRGIFTLLKNSTNENKRSTLEVKLPAFVESVKIEGGGESLPPPPPLLQSQLRKRNLPDDLLGQGVKKAPKPVLASSRVNKRFQ